MVHYMNSCPVQFLGSQKVRVEKVNTIQKILNNILSKCVSFQTLLSPDTHTKLTGYGQFCVANEQQFPVIHRDASYLQANILLGNILFVSYVSPCICFGQSGRFPQKPEWKRS